MVGECRCWSTCVEVKTRLRRRSDIATLVSLPLSPTAASPPSKHFISNSLASIDKVNEIKNA